MIGLLLEWSLQNRLFVLLSGLLLLLWGGYETTRMPVDVFPDLTAPTVTLMTEAHGMAPAEVEQLVTFPIEAVMNGAPGVRRVRSTTGVGYSIVNVEFAWGSDLYQARQIVAEKLQLARSALPQDLPSPILTPITSVMGEILFVALRSDRHDGMTLKTTADWTLRRRLLAVPGVAEVIAIGSDTKQYQVEIRPERLVACGLSLHQVIEAVRAANTNAAAGFLTSGGPGVPDSGIGARLADRGPCANGCFIAARSGSAEAPGRHQGRPGAQARHRLSRWTTGRHHWHSEAAPGKHARIDRAVGTHPGPNSGRAAGRHAHRQQHFSPSRFHRCRDRQPRPRAARWVDAGGDHRRCFSSQSPRHSDNAGGDPPFVDRASVGDARHRRHPQHHDLGWVGHRAGGAGGRRHHRGGEHCAPAAGTVGTDSTATARQHGTSRQP